MFTAQVAFFGNPILPWLPRSQERLVMGIHIDIYILYIYYLIKADKLGSKNFLTMHDRSC